MDKVTIQQILFSHGIENSENLAEALSEIFDQISKDRSFVENISEKIDSENKRHARGGA
jgi:hypothetical protein